VRATATRGGSELSTVWLAFHVVDDRRSAAADLSASSLVLKSRSVVCWALIEPWRICSRVLPWRSSAMSCSTIVAVSTPDAMPESPRSATA
jgi:hypothetical protein